jgi:hypothetical protein
MKKHSLAFPAPIVVCLLCAITPMIAVTPAWGDAPPPPLKAPAQTSDDGNAIAKLGETERAVIVTRKNGTTFKIPAGKDRSGDANVIVGIMAVSAKKDWAVVNCSTEDGLGGSEAGSIATTNLLVSVEHRRFLEPEDLGLPAGTYFVDIERKGDVEVLLYTVQGKDRKIELGKLGERLAKAKPRK